MLHVFFLLLISLLLISICFAPGPRKNAPVTDPIGTCVVQGMPGQVPADIWASTEITAAPATLRPFTHMFTTRGVIFAAMPHVNVDFLKHVKETFEQMIPRDDSGTKDSNLQRKVIEYMAAKKALIPIWHGHPSDLTQTYTAAEIDGFGADIKPKFSICDHLYELDLTQKCSCEQDGVKFCNFDQPRGTCEDCPPTAEICEKSGLPAAGVQDCKSRCFGPPNNSPKTWDTIEVVEHLLHWINNLGVHAAFERSWGISHTSTLYTQMNEAISRGLYDVSEYTNRDILENDRVKLQEYSYWVITCYWGLLPTWRPNNQEFKITTAEDLKAKQPRMYTLCETQIDKVLSLPQNICVYSNSCPPKKHTEIAIAEDKETRVGLSTDTGKKTGIFIIVTGLFISLRLYRTQSNKTFYTPLAEEMCNEI